MDQVMEIGQREAEETMRALARVEGIFAGEHLIAPRGLSVFILAINLFAKPPRILGVDTNLQERCQKGKWGLKLKRPDEVCIGCLVLIAVLPAGVSSGGAVSAALRLSATVNNATIVCIICDRGDRYLSTGVSTSCHRCIS